MSKQLNELYGSLREKLRRRKKVDEWVFHSPYADAIGRLAGYKAEIYLLNQRRDGLAFAARSKHFKEELVDSDIQRLRVAVEKAFQLADMADRKITWEDWIEIEMPEEHYFNEEHGIELNITWRKLLRGVHPETGKAYTIHHSNKVVVPFPNAKKAGEEDPNTEGEKWFNGRDIDTQYSYIPATKANLAALKELCARVASARERLRDLLDQERAQGSLASVKNLLLEAPKQG